MAPLAAIMKSSIRSRARFFRVTASDSMTPSFATGVASTVSKSSAPACSRTRFSRLGGAILQPELRLERVVGGDLVGLRSAPLEPRADDLVRRASRG